jgi:hypothetical protein
LLSPQSVDGDVMMKIGQAMEVSSRILKSNRELVKFPGSARNGWREVCVSDDRRFASVFSASGGGTSYLVVSVFQGENPKADHRWLCLAMTAS